MIHFRSTHGARLGASDFDGRAPRTLQDLITHLSALPLLPTRVMLSHLQCLMENEDSEDFEQKMRRQHLTPQAQDWLNQRAVRENVKFRIFTKMPILLIQETFRQHNNPDLPEIALDQLIYPLGEAILIANDVCNSITAAPTQDPSTPENYAIFALREILFNHQDQFRYVIGRSFMVYEGLRERCRTEYPDDFFDLNDFFRSKLGISLGAYFHTIFALNSNWGHQTFDRADVNTFTIHPERWLQNIASRDDINAIVDRWTQEWNEAQVLTGATPTNDIRSFLYELFSLRDRPLLRSPQGLLCGNLSFIKRKYWDGPYYEVIAAGTNAEKDQFFRFLGRTLEMYVQGLLKAAFRNRFKKLISSAGNPISDAVVDLNPNWRLVFEVKAKRPTRDMVSGTQAPAELRSVAQMAFEGLEQLDRRIQEMITDGYRGRITPILVTGGHFPINDFLWRHYFRQVETLTFFTQEQVDWPQFMDVEALEVFTALSGKTRVADMMREKLGEDWKKESLQNFLFAHYLKTGRVQEPFNPVCQALYQDRMANLTATLFPESARQMPADSSWKRAFEIT